MSKSGHRLFWFVLLAVLCLSSARHKKRVWKQRRVSSMYSEDSTLEPYATGAGTVEATCDKIAASCVFEEDKEFTRRLGYTESHDGTDEDTFRPGYYGGIWQVDEDYFATTQSAEAYTHLQPYYYNISVAFGIDWLTVHWENLTIPLYSALGARLFLHWESVDVNSQIPRDVEEQGDYWVKYYRPAEDAQQFVDDAYAIAKGCTNSRSDLIFLLDESGSIGAENFELVKDFVKSVINETDVGLETTRVAVITYSTDVHYEFPLDEYDLKQDMLDAVDAIIYSGGATNTHLGLDAMRINGFSYDNGARDPSQHPHVGIVLTDGASGDEDATIEAADACHAEGITMFAIGVGTTVDTTELEAIASNPVCQHLYYLEEGFAELESLVYSIEKGTCDAPIVVEPSDNSTTDGTIPPGEDQNCKITVPPEGVTVKITSENGQSTFYMALLTYPSEDYYDDKVDAYPGIPGVMYIEQPDTPDHMVFCNIKGNNETTVNITIGVRPGDQDYCANYTSCVNGFCVDNDLEGVACSCDPGYTGVYCEEDINECSSSPCKNGECSNNQNSWSCSCSDGWTGTDCSTETEESTDISPDPFMVVPLNGTFTAAYDLTQDCSVSYSKEFRNSFEEVVSRLSTYLGDNMCTYSIGLRGLAADINQVTTGNNVQFYFNTYVYPEDDMEHFRYAELCSFEARDYLKNHANWRSPIIPSIINCPSNTPTPSYYDIHSHYWDVYTN